MHTITQKDLKRYLHGATSKKQTEHIKVALKNDWKLRLSLETLASMQTLPDHHQATLSDKVIEKLLEYGAERQRNNFRPL